jgi:hypothetical protein
LQDNASMSGIDLPALSADGADAARQLVRQKRIPKAIRIACEALTSGDSKTVTAAAEKAGISREYLSRRLSEPHVAEYLRQKAMRVVAIAAGRASGRMTELIDAESEHVSFDASRHVLGVAGIKPAESPQVAISIAVAGYVIDLRDDPIDVTPNKPANNSGQ